MQKMQEPQSFEDIIKGIEEYKEGGTKFANARLHMLGAYLCMIAVAKSRETLQESIDLYKACAADDIQLLRYRWDIMRNFQ